MPKMGDAMEEGTLVKWLKSEGDEVSEGDPIAEIETDKVTLELEAEDSGTLAQLIAERGRGIAVGEAIAFIAGEGEEVPGAAAKPAADRRPRKRRRRRRRRRSPGPDRHGDRGRGRRWRPAGPGRRPGERPLPCLADSAAAGPGEQPRPLADRGFGTRGPHRRARRAGGDGERRQPRPTDGKAEVRLPEAAERRQAAQQGFQPAHCPNRPGRRGPNSSSRAGCAGHRRADDAGQAAGPALLRHRRGRDGRCMALRKQLNEQLEEQGPEALDQRLRDEGVALALKELPEPQRSLDLQGHRAAPAGGHGDGGRARRRAS